MKHYYLIVDTETTKRDTVADFGAVIVTRQGEIVEQFGAMVLGHFGTLPLFYDDGAAIDSFWSEQSAQRRVKAYDDMLDKGARSISSVALINQWLAGVNARYRPVLTAYNIAFDLGKCRKTGINLGIFGKRFCLMKAAKAAIGTLADYQNFCEARGLLTAKLRRPQMTADAMAKYILGDSLEDEPHTALEDARDYEAAILAYLLKTHTRKQILSIGN
jgi:DNA polymerase III, alpha subunit (gram-positive type)